MRRRDLADLVLLAALWGASFLFTRIAAPAFGPLALAELRVAIAAVMLLVLLAWRAGLGDIRKHALRFLLLGAVCALAAHEQAAATASRDAVVKSLVLTCPLRSPVPRAKRVPPRRPFDKLFSPRRPA